MCSGGYDLAKPRCLLAIAVASMTIATMSGREVSFAIFHGQLCDGYIYCASNFVERELATTQCEDLGMTLAHEVREDKKNIADVLEQCAFPLPGIGSHPYYWINSSLAIDLSKQTCTLIQSSTHRYLTKKEFCFGGNYPYICEEIPEPGWKQVDGRFFGLTSLKHNLCEAASACKRLGGGVLSNVAGANMSGLVLKLRLEALFPIFLWVNTTGNTCQQQMSTSLSLKAGAKYSYETTSTVYHLHGLCEKDSSLATAVPVTNTLRTSSLVMSGPTTNILQTSITVQANTVLETNTQQTSTMTVVKPTRNGRHNSTVGKTVHTTKTQATSTLKTTDSLKSSSTNPSYVVLMSTTNLPTDRPQSTFTSIQNHSTESGWIIDNQREFFVNNNGSNFTEATETCADKMNASMVFFINPLQYLDMSKILQLRPGHFWVGVAVNSSHHKCLQLRVDQSHDAVLSKADCRQMAASICSRSSNVSDVLGNPTFVRLLKDMTIDSSKTLKAQRKLISVYEERKSATAVGSIGVIVVAAVLTLIALLDLTHLKCRWMGSYRKMEKVKLVHERRLNASGYPVSDSTC